MLGDYNALRELLSEYRPDVLILADLDPSMAEMLSLAQVCIKEGVQFKSDPLLLPGLLLQVLNLESLSGVPVIGITKLPLDRMHNRFFEGHRRQDRRADRPLRFRFR